jgi:hypothetical protein
VIEWDRHGTRSIAEAGLDGLALGGWIAFENRRCFSRVPTCPAPRAAAPVTTKAKARARIEANDDLIS